jgi:hypothetical protein
MDFLVLLSIKDDIHINITKNEENFNLKITFNPGTWAKKASTVCEWYKAPWPTAPDGALIVSFPQSNKLPDLFLNFAG